MTKTYVHYCRKSCMVKILIFLLIGFNTSLSFAENDEYDFLKEFDTNKEDLSLVESNTINSLVGTVRFRCDPKTDQFLIDRKANCKVPTEFHDVYKCKFDLESSRCLSKSKRVRRKGKFVKTCKKKFSTNIIMNKAVLNTKEKIDITYFIHGKITRRGQKVAGEKGVVGRYKIEERLKNVEKPMVFVYPEFITDKQTSKSESKHFLQFRNQEEWLELQNTVEQYVGLDRIGKRNLMAHSLAYVVVLRMKSWDKLKFDSTTMIDSIYGKAKALQRWRKCGIVLGHSLRMQRLR